VDLATYFQLVADWLGVPLEASVVIPQESRGFAYATGCDPCPKGKKPDGEKSSKKNLNQHWVEAVFDNSLQ